MGKLETGHDPFLVLKKSPLSRGHLTIECELHHTTCIRSAIVFEKLCGEPNGGFNLVVGGGADQGSDKQTVYRVGLD